MKNKLKDERKEKREKRKERIFLAFFIFLFSFFFSCGNPLVTQIVEPKTIVFDSGGGSHVESQIVYKGYPVIKPAEPYKSGYTFDAWYSGNTFQEKWDFTTVPKNDMTLYANWNAAGNEGGDITSVAVTVTSPVKGGTPSATATAGGMGYICGTVTWLPNENPFQGGKQYTATVTLTAESGYTFTGLSGVTINGNTASFSGNTGTAVTLAYTFAATLDKVITGISIKTQPTKLTYTHGDILDLSGLAVTLAYDDISTEDIALNGFAAKNISASPANGAGLSYTTHNTQPVKITVGTHSVNTNNLTVNKATPPDITFPTASVITYGATLSTSALTGGGSTNGTFAWANGTTVPAVTNSGYNVVFTPSDAVNYDYSGISGWNGTAVVRSVAITVNPKSIIITPTTGQSKVFGAADPEFTYTPSEALLSGNSFSGELSRAAGETVGTYAFTAGTISAGANYTLTLGGSVTFAITKTAGAAVGTPTAAGNADSLSITVNAVTAPGNGQTVEYAINTTANAPASGWQDGLAFTGLSVSTPYYIFARSKENTSYNAGTASVSAAITFYTVTFNSNGGSNVTPKNVTSGGMVTEPAAPALSGNDFGGWYKEAALTNPWNFASDTVTGPVTLYAKWIPATYGITLSQSGTYPFTAATFGYTAQTPLSVTVTNNGNQATGTLTAALSGANPGSFTLSITSINSIATSGTDMFTVTPNTGLAAGAYTAVVTVSGGSVTAQTFNVSFTVNPKVIIFTVDAIAAQTYTGSAITPTITVRDGSTTLTLTTHYTASYSNNTNAGTATVTITGAGNYAGSTGSGTFTVNKAPPTVSSWPTAANISSGAALSASALSGGTSSTPGTFAWTAGTTVPPAGMNSYSVTFTPTDTANYDTVTGSVSITVIAVGSAGITINFTEITEGAPSLGGPAVIYRSSANGPTTYTFTLDNPGQYTSIDWYVYSVTGSGGTFTLNSSNVAYNMVGTHSLTLEVVKGGLLYSRTITFKVEL